MKLVVMLLIFAGGVYFLVHRHQVEVRRQAQIAEQERKAKAAALEEAALKQAPERDHTIRLSQKTLQTLRELTEDPNEEVRYASAELLWQLQDEQVPNIIKRLLADETRHQAEGTQDPGQGQKQAEPRNYFQRHLRLRQGNAP